MPLSCSLSCVERGPGPLSMIWTQWMNWKPSWKRPIVYPAVDVHPRPRLRQPCYLACCEYRMPLLRPPEPDVAVRITRRLE